MTSTLDIYEDVNLPAGSVVIDVEDARTEPGPLALTVARKNLDRPYLGPHGWQASEYLFTPRSVRPGIGRSEMIFGGELTRHISVDMNITLGVPALAISERRFWPAIAAEPDADGISIQGTSRPPVRATALQARPVEEIPGPAAAAPLLQQPDPVPPEPARIEPVVLTSEPIIKKRCWWIPAAALFLLLLAVLVIGNIVLSHFYQSGNQPPAPEAAAPQPDFAARYRTYLGQQGQAEALLSLGREALAANATDVGFNAVTLAADRGLASAKLLLGQWYDPLTTPRGPVRANPNNAAVYYAEAATGGTAEASMALQRLCRAATATPRPDWSQDFDNRTHCP